MISINSNCSRVDLVKGEANQLKLQVAASPQAASEDAPARKVKNDLQTLDAQIKTGNAKKAETALATAKRDAGGEQAETNSQIQSSKTSLSSSGLDAYA